jgi:hypothetical protein
VASGELIEDATGRSSLYVPGKGSRPAPDGGGRVTSSLAPVGLNAGQTIRVTFLNAGGSPLEVLPCFFDGGGEHLKEGERLTLAPGQMLTFEMSRGEVGARAEGRVEVRGAAHVGEAEAKHLLMAGEVVEEATGKSVLYVPPPFPAR